MSSFEIRIKAGTPAKFDHNPLTAHPNDSVSWANDDQVAHWLAPGAATPKGWLNFQIAPDGESSQISLTGNLYRPTRLLR